jgi:A/G-specific adenine glycosylase
LELSPRDAQELQSALLAWFNTVKRPLPWRLERTLYGTWISEVMLQQTTVATVEPYWLRFLKLFPDVRALAAASEQEVLACWSGLGYYRRARHLHQAARQVLTGGGQLPCTRAGWAALPGIGDYASGAIASLALGERVPALDANARRVLTRWLVGDPGDLPGFKPRYLAERAANLVPEANPGDWNEAVMELGALVCRARNPVCSECPVLHLCRAGLAGTAGDIPGSETKPTSQAVRLGVLGVKHGRRLLLMPQGGSPVLSFRGRRKSLRADFSTLHQGLLGLPGTAWVCPDSGSGPWDIELQQGFARWLFQNELGQAGFSFPKPVEVGEFHHAITRYRLRVKVFLLELPPVEESVGGVKDIDPSDSNYYSGAAADSGRMDGFQLTGSFVANPGEQPLSGLARKALDLLGDNFG